MRLIVPQRWPAIRGLGTDGSDDSGGDYTTIGDDPTTNLQDIYLPTLTSVGLDTTPGYTGGATSPSGSGLNAAQLASILGTAANTATSIYKSTLSPYVIPGTNLVANPGGTAILGATGSAALGSSLSSISPLLIILVIGGIALMSMGKH
jgi:hypothetical protein